MGSRAVISIRGGLSRESFRFAVAHELGHLELHPAKNYLNLCTDIAVESSDYLSSGHEPEANAFAAELLMPESLVSRFADVKQVTWEPVRAIAAEFQVPLTSAALRFVASCPERVALVSSVRGKVDWTARGRDFGHWIAKQPLDRFTLAFDYWDTGRVSRVPETVSANAWIEALDDDAELVEHAIALPGYDQVLSLLWIKSDAEF